MTTTHMLAETQERTSYLPTRITARERFNFACQDFAGAAHNPSLADFEIGRIVKMADAIVMAVRAIGAEHQHLTLATGSRWEPDSIASQMVDAVQLEPRAAAVLQTAVERRIPAPHRVGEA